MVYVFSVGFQTVLLPAYTAYGDGTDRLFQNVVHIKFRRRGITQKKEYCSVLSLFLRVL